MKLSVKKEIGQSRDSLDFTDLKYKYNIHVPLLIVLKQNTEYIFSERI